MPHFPTQTGSWIDCLCIIFSVITLKNNSTPKALLEYQQVRGSLLPSYDRRIGGRSFHVAETWTVVNSFLFFWTCLSLKPKILQLIGEGPGRLSKLRQTRRNNPALTLRQNDSMVPSYDQESQEVNDWKSNTYFNLSMRLGSAVFTISMCNLWC